MPKYANYPARPRVAVQADLAARKSGPPPTPDCRGRACPGHSPESALIRRTNEFLGDGFTVTAPKQSTRKSTKRLRFSPVRTYNIADQK